MLYNLLLEMRWYSARKIIDVIMKKMESLKVEIKIIRMYI